MTIPTEGVLVGRGEGVAGGGGYSDFCLLQGLGLFFFFFNILNFAMFWVSSFCQLFLWVCEFGQVFFGVCHFPLVFFGGVSLKILICILILIYKVQ